MFLLDFSAELSSSVAVDLVRAESTILLFLASCFFLLGNTKEGLTQLNKVRYLFVMLVTGTITSFIAFYVFAVWEGFLGYYLNKQLNKT